MGVELRTKGEWFGIEKRKRVDLGWKPFVNT